MRRYGRHLLAGFPDAGYTAIPALKQVWSVAFADVADARLPSTLAPEELFVRAPYPDRRWAIHQRGAGLVVMPWVAPGPGDERGPGSPVATLAAATPELWVERGEDPRAERAWLAQRLEVGVRADERVRLRSDRGEVAIEAWKREPWAVAAGRDRYGLWAAFEVAGVEQRVRWIPPGRFLMGSPESEAGRWANEGPQHWVTITRGYWLGETAVTQALWTAVMGKNPSRFRSDDRPVERVSWDECQAFLARLDRAVDGFAARLPTEAEWERACRAGTTTATWAGDPTWRGERDSPELNDIAWYGGNSAAGFELDNGYDVSDWPDRHHRGDRAGTHPVGQKRPNPYGLHDMLGNVFEWCQDESEMHAPARYVAENVDDPVVRQGLHRVYRGGSWDSFALLVRAAYRYSNEPGYRVDSLGFRLAGGRAAPSPLAEEAPSGDGRRGGRDDARAEPTKLRRRKSPAKSTRSKKNRG